MSKEYKYATPNLDNFSIQLGGGVVTAVGKVLTLTEYENAELQKLLKTGRPDISAHLVLIDTEVAEKLALADIAARQAKPQAQSGAVSATVKPNSVADGKVIPVDVTVPPGTNSKLAAMLAGNKDHVLAEAAVERKEIKPIEETAFHNEDTSNLPPKPAV